jgi:hypothetical protein
MDTPKGGVIDSQRQGRSGLGPSPSRWRRFRSAHAGDGTTGVATVAGLAGWVARAQTEASRYSQPAASRANLVAAQPDASRGRPLPLRVGQHAKQRGVLDGVQRTGEAAQLSAAA